MGHSVDEFISKHQRFSILLTEIRSVLLSTDLVETMKWGMPTYTINNKNIIGLGAFKSYCGLWFFQGAFLKDTHKVLQNAQEGKTKAMRQWRFNPNSRIELKLLRSYIIESIDNENKGLRIKAIKKPLVIAPELNKVLSENKKLSKLFNELNLTKKREFSDYISEAKKEETKIKRLKKITPMIMNSIGLHDSYKNR